MFNEVKSITPIDLTYGDREGTSSPSGSGMRVIGFDQSLDICSSWLGDALEMMLAKLDGQNSAALTAKEASDFAVGLQIIGLNMKAMRGALAKGGTA